MTTKHTPGPWKILKGKKGFLGQPETEWKDQWEVRAEEPKMYGGTTVFNLGVSFDLYNAQHEANARLIASAPELLEALKEILETNQKRRPGIPVARSANRMVEIAKQAIAKAEGRE